MSLLSKLAAFVPGGQVVAVLGFVRDYWKPIALALVVGAIFWAGGMGPRAELRAQQAKWAEEKAEQDAEDVADLAASIEYADEANRRTDEREKGIAALWSAELDRVRRESAGRPAEPQPVRPRAEVCSDAPGNSRLSDALASYRAEVGASVERLRRELAASRLEAGRLLAVCHKQAGDLDEAVSWREREDAIWGEDGQPRVLR